MDTIRRSFKTHNNINNKSERRPILNSSEDDEDQVTMHAINSEVIVKIDDGTHRDNNVIAPIRRDPSYDFWNDTSTQAIMDSKKLDSIADSSEFTFTNNPNNEEDPPTKLIHSFLHKQTASGGEMMLDMDLEMAELKKVENSSDQRVSFKSREKSSSSDEEERNSVRKRANNSMSKTAADGGDGGEVLRCTSNVLLRTKTKSRLMDPPPAIPARVEDVRKSARLPPKSGQVRSSQLKSGQIGRSQVLDEEDDDPFKDEDIPDEFKSSKFGLWSFVQWISLVLIIAALVCSLTIPVLQRVTVWKLHLWKWELLILVLFSGRLVSGWVIKFAVFLVERNFLFRKRVIYFVYGLRNAVQNCLWFGLVLLSWHLMFDKKVERETKSKALPYITKFLSCCLVATVLWLVKTFLVKVLASSFHVSTYFERIQESVFNQYIVETLSGPPLIEIENMVEEEDKMMAEMQKLQNAGARVPNDLKATAFPNKGGSGRSSGLIGRGNKSGALGGKDAGKQQDEGITIEQLMKLNQKNVSAWNMKRLMKIVRHGTLATIDEQIMRESAGDENAIEIKSEYEAKIAAKKIFQNVARPGVKYIYLADLMRFMREDEAIKTFSLFEGSKENNRISRKALKNWVVNAFKERRALSLTLNDSKTAVDKLHQMANVVVGVITFGLSLLILGIASTHFFVFLSSQLLLAVFVFGNTLKTVFEAIVFLFVMHPFDVGDRCEVDGVQMVVEEMNIMTTVFLRFDNQKITYPNSVLATKPIGNYYRSPDMGEGIDFCVHVATPVEKLAIMRERIIAYMESKKDHWHPSPSVVLRDVDDMNRLKISIWMRHRVNFQDMGIRFERRELVLQEMIKVLKELDIEYRMLPMDVNVRNMPAVNSTRLPSTWTTFN